MKRKSLFFAALTVILLVGCRNEEQSKLSLDALGESAVISGQVMYSAGIDTIGTDYTADVIQPAVGKKVTILVPLSEYKSGSTGTRSFECTINAEGYFSDTIPCTKEGLNNVSIRLEEFATQRNMAFLRMENGKPVFDVRMCKFDGEIANISLKPGMNYLEEVVHYAYAPMDMRGYNEMATLTGSVRLPVETAYGIGSYVDAANCNLEITIQDGTDIAESKNQPFTYGVTTDAKGDFKINLPIKSLKEGFQLNSIIVLAKNEKAFKHFKKDGSTVQFAGAYKLRAFEDRNVNYYTVLTDIVKDIECNIGSLALEFVPNYNNEVAQTVDPAGWNSKLAGWMLGWADFTDYTETATLSGKMMMAKETAFGVGDYEAAAREIVSLTLVSGSYPLSTIEIPTDENGNYSITVPVKQAGVKPFSVTVDIKQPETISFVHYVDASSTRTLKEGSWSLYKTLNNNDANWNELGTSYCKFTPDASLQVNTFTDELLGWYKNGGSFVTPEISGQIKLAKEQSLAIGSYEDAQDLRVRATFDSEVSVVVPVVDGAFHIVLPITSENKKYSNVNITLMDDKDLAFAHFTADKTMKLEGQYELFVQDKGAEWNECGTYYYKFKPSVTEETYIDYLAAWQVVPGYNASVTVSGEVFQAYEKSYAIGAFKAAQNQVVTVTASASELGIGGMKFAAPVDENGKFSIVLPLEQEGDVLDYRPSVSVGGDAIIKDFVHYKDFSGATCNLKGQYKELTRVNDPKADKNELGQIYFEFVPNDDNKPSNIESFDNNLVGWYVAPFSYIKGDVFTGTVMKPQEDGFWKGSYAAFANQKITISTGKGQSWVVLTDDNGKYSYQSYKVNEDSQVNVSISLTDKQNKEEAFVHYVDMLNSKETVVEGTYWVSYPYSWSERGKNMGITYLAFSPNSTPADWTSNLFGWQQVKFVEPGQSKGNAKFQLYAQKAIETATVPHQADWTDAGKQKVTVSITDKNTFKTYSFSTLSSGRSINFTLPWTSELEGASAYVSVDFTCDTKNSATFIHYPIVDEPTSNEIKGHWVNLGNIYNVLVEYNQNSNNAFECKNSAKLRFQPESTPEGWYLYDWNAIVNAEIE